jgi:hypothetical protein
MATFLAFSGPMARTEKGNGREERERGNEKETRKQEKLSLTNTRSLMPAVYGAQKKSRKGKQL